MDVEKMKVAELRAALAERGLDTKGNKPVLVARLKEFLDSENSGEEVAAEQPEETAEEPAAADEPMDETPEPVKETPAPVAEKPAPVVEKPAPVAEKPAPAPAAVVKPVEAKPEPDKVADEPAAKPAAAEKTESTEEPKPAEPKPEEKSAEKRGQKRKRNDDEPFVVTEDEPELAENFMCLDWQNSDLTLKINKETFCNAEPFHVAAWGYVFSSGRATHGFQTGKIGFEVKWVGNMEVKLDDVKDPLEMRVGWSTKDSNLQAGESALSYCYSNLSKKANNSAFEDYGAAFTKDDVISAMIDFEAANNNVEISFAKNGEAQGVAFSVPKADLAGQGHALFPHISVRNVKIEANFGKDKAGNVKENWFPLPEGFKMAAEQIEIAQRGFLRPEKRDDCEVIMMVGLPGCGKTTWATKHMEENFDKHFNLIGTSNLLDRMKVNGEPRKKHVTSNWETLVSKMTKCVQDMVRLASQRRRNFILDQTNVFSNAQKRKVRPFEGMKRKAVIIVPSDEDYKARIEAQEKAESKDVPDNAVMEMKANFTLPEEGEDCPFVEVIYTELQKEDAAKVVAEYNKDAKEKGFGKKQENSRKRGRGAFNRGQMRGGQMRGQMRGGRGMMMRGRGGPMGRGAPRGMFPQRGGPFPPRGFMRGGPMRGGPMGPPRGMPYGMPNRGAMGSNRGFANRGGAPPPMGMRGAGGRGGRGNGGQKFGGGGPAPWGGPQQAQPSPWQQQPQQQRPPQGQNWGQMWNQGQNMNNAWGAPQRGGGQGNQGNHFGGWNNAGGGNAGFGNNQGYPGNQNWGGYR